MKKIVVTGAAGLVGQNLIPMLINEGYSVTAIDRNPNLSLLQYLNPKAKCIRTDVSNIGEWQKEFKGAFCVVQLHAQIASPRKKQFYRSNVDGVQNVLDACKKFKVKNLVHLSSSVAISSANDDYTITKRIGEKLVKQSKIPFMTLRPPLMYGSFDSKHLGWITRLMEKTPIVPLPGSGEYVRQPLYVKDLCNVIVELTKRKPKNKTWNIIGRERITYVDLLRIIAEVRGWKRLFVPISLPLFGFMLRIYSIITGKPMFTADQMKALVAGDEFQIEKWCEEFNVSYTPFREAIKEIWNGPNAKYSKIMASPH